MTETAPADQRGYKSLHLSDLRDDADKQYTDLPADMWGVSILFAIKDLPAICSGKASVINWARGLFGLCGLSLNLCLQFVVLFYVQRFIVGQAVHDTQEHYAQFHREVYDQDGSFNQEKWKAWDGPYMELCNMAMSKMRFTMAVVFMWTARMLGELRSIRKLHLDFWELHALPKDASATDMLFEYQTAGGDTEYRLIFVTPLTRFAIYMTVILPKLLIAFFLMYIGCRWLAATESFSDLILNALALEFVIGTDELVFDNFAPQRMKQWVEVTKIQHAKSTSSDISPEGQESDDEKRAIVWAYFKSIGFMVICGAWSYAYLYHLERVIPGFKRDIHNHCGGWFLKRYEPPCPFTTSDPDKCFPFGQ